MSSSLSNLLTYDARSPLGLKVLTTVKHGDVITEDITFRGIADDGSPVAAYVVRPAAGSGPFAAVLFVHWYAPRFPDSNRTQFLSEARALARRGVVSLLVSTFWSDPSRYRARRWQDDYRNTINQARDLRHALNVLLSRPGVDSRRVAYVGHDYGAMFGALISAVERRPKAYVLIAGAPRFPDWYLYGSASGVPTGAELDAFRKQFAPLDPVNAVRLSKANFFLQFGEADRYTPRASFIELYAALPETGRMATYLSDHPMNAETIRHDRTLWLADQLGLPQYPDVRPEVKAGL